MSRTYPLVLNTVSFLSVNLFDFLSTSEPGLRLFHQLNQHFFWVFSMSDVLGMVPETNAIARVSKPHMVFTQTRIRSTDETNGMVSF